MKRALFRNAGWEQLRSAELELTPGRYVTLSSEAEPLHKCAVCGATELTDPNLDFRVARDGEEYCMAHLPKAETPAH